MEKTNHWLFTATKNFAIQIGLTTIALFAMALFVMGLQTIGVPQNYSVLAFTLVCIFVMNVVVSRAASNFDRRFETVMSKYDSKREIENAQ